MIDDPAGDLTNNPLPPIDPGLVTPLTYTYYDNYSWSGHLSFRSSYLSKTTAAGNSYAESPSTYSPKTRGLVTGTKVRVLGSSPEKWLTTTTYYDDKGRVLQIVSDNITGGTDVITHKYDFSGKLLSSYVVNHNSQSAVTPETRVLTENLYDAAGRLKTITKTINDQTSTKRTIATNSYNELGQLKTKTLGNSLETLTYTYNIRGWLRGINKWYANGGTPPTGGAGGGFFGMELNYDYGFTQNQFNGNIAGEKWRSKGDGARRAYGFSYDAAGRLTKADFTQYNSGWNTSAGVDYSVSNLTYDADGNIMSMNQKGLITTTSGTVDNLTYGYKSNSNQLDHVTDNGGTSAALGDFKDKHTGSGDYSYDANGNLNKDLNKGISSITYNHLNLPGTITFSGKGTIKFVYDATGKKLQKIVIDNTTSPSRTVVTNYIDGFIYQHTGSTAQDTLQFFPTEEGRVRSIPLPSGGGRGWAYDYFIKDHLGNTRVVLTEQTDFTQYLATMEPEKAQTEDALFYNLNTTREPKPVDYPPQADNITTPNKAVAKLNGKDPDKRIGPSIILKVMAGDTIQAVVRAFYRKKATPKKNAGVPAEQMLAGLLQALVAPGSQAIAMHGGQLTPDAEITGPGLTANDLRQLKNKDPENKKLNKPKAYLNYVFFDKELKFVDEGSGVKQVDEEAGELETLSSGKIVAKKNGYVYVFTSDESSQDVLFDNLGVMQITGPVLEETHYYPFGLTMAAISTTAPLRLEGKRKFNGIEFNHKEFSDGSGLDLYTAKFRGLDPQIGRWWQIDTKPNTSLSPYAAMDLNPILKLDPLGDTTIFHSIKGEYLGTINDSKGYSDAIINSKKFNGLLKANSFSVSDGIISAGEKAKLSVNELSNTLLDKNEGGGQIINMKGDLGLLSRVVFAEARGEKYVAKEAVADIIRNRVKSKRFPNTYEDVIKQPYQFSSLLQGDPNRRVFDNPYQTVRSGNNIVQSAWIESVGAAIKVYNGYSGISGGALLYYSPMSMRPRGSTPNWNFKVLQEIIIEGVRKDKFRFFKYK